MNDPLKAGKYDFQKNLEDFYYKLSFIIIMYKHLNEMVLNSYIYT